MCFTFDLINCALGMVHPVLLVGVAVGRFLDDIMAMRYKWTKTPWGGGVIFFLLFFSRILEKSFTPRDADSGEGGGGHGRGHFENI